MANFVGANNARRNSWSSPRAFPGTSRETAARHRRPDRRLPPRKNRGRARTKFYYLYLKFIIARHSRPRRSPPAAAAAAIHLSGVFSRPGPSRGPNLSFLRLFINFLPPAESRSSRR